MKYLAPLALIMLAAPVLAADDPKAQDSSEQAKDTSQNRTICKRQKNTGSRLGSKRVCRTEAQWEALRQAERQAVERAQNQRTKST